MFSLHKMFNNSSNNGYSNKKALIKITNDQNLPMVLYFPWVTDVTFKCSLKMKLLKSVHFDNSMNQFAENSEKSYDQSRYHIIIHFITQHFIKPKIFSCCL